MPSIRIRRPSQEARIEMTPLLDVIFLLLTFFMYSLVLMVRAQILPVTLPELTTGESTQGMSNIVGITLDGHGRLFLNREPISEDALRERFVELAEWEKQPTLFLAMEQEGQVDRAPLFLRLIEMARSAGLGNLNIVGPASSDAPATP